MATLADTGTVAPFATDQRERRFFMGLAIAIAATVLLGFGAYIALGISSFGAPWWVHVHAVTYMGWIALYLNQNRLVVSGDIAGHRRMGRIMAGWAVWMTVVGLSVLVFNIATHRTPPIFTPAFIIALDGVNLLVFLLLLGAGLALRDRSDWHRRLMLSATVCIISPALGRITVIAGGFSLRNIILVQLCFILAGMIGDWRIRGRVHPAWYCGGAALIAMGLVTGPVAGLAPVIALANSLAAG